MVEKIAKRSKKRKKKKKEKGSEMNKLLSIIVAIGLLAGWYFSRSLKYQWIRVIDILVIGPLCVWASTQIQRPILAKIMLAFFGSALITFNFKNYVACISSGKPWM